MTYPTNSALPEDVLATIPEESHRTAFRATLNSGLSAGNSEYLAFLKAYRAAADAGWSVEKDNPTQSDVHVDAPLGSGKKKPEDDEDKLYVPPVEVREAAKKAAEAGSVEGIADDLMGRLACETGVLAGDVKKVALYFAKSDPAQAWGMPHAMKWAGRVMRKLHADTEVAKAGNGVMLAFWPDPELANKLAVDGGEDPDQLHVTLAYFGSLADIPIDRLPALEAAVASFAASHAPMSATLGGIGKFPATPHSDGQDVAYLAVHGDDLQDFRRQLVEAVEGAGCVPKKNFGYTPHMTLKMLPQGSKEDVPAPKSQDVIFSFVRLSIGGAAKDYKLTGKQTAKTEEDFEISGSIVKVDQSQHLVFGWFSIVTIGGKPVEDTQQDIITPDTIEASAYDFVLNARTAGEMHEDGKDGQIRGVGRLVESCVFTADKVQAMVASLQEQGIHAVIQLNCIPWWGGMKIDDPETWNKITTGSLKAWSIGGTGKREKLAA